MNLSELIAAVYTETNRPDLVPETLQSVLEATLSLHTIDNFYKDIQEATIVFDQPTWYIQQIDTSSIPFYRNMAYVRKSDPNTSYSVEQQNLLLPTTFPCSVTQFNFLKRIDIGDILDSFGYEKNDVWYQAGKTINIKSSTQLQYAQIGWYAYPNISSSGSNFSSWIADEQPYAIIYKAASSLFAKIGEDKSWAIYSKAPIPGQGDETGGLFYQQLAQLKRNNILASGW